MTPFRILFLLFLLVPMVEIYLLIKVGGVIGALPTVLLVVLTALIGALLLRWQGFATLQRVQSELAQGQIPAEAMLEGVVLLLAGALLLTPGFFTDTIGFLCLLPMFRRWLIRQLLNRMVLQSFSATASTAAGSARQGRVIEGEYRRGDGD